MPEPDDRAVRPEPDDDYPPELQQMVDHLEEQDRRRAEIEEAERKAAAERGPDRRAIAREYAECHRASLLLRDMLARPIIEFVALALASGVVGNVGYGLLKAAVKHLGRRRLRVPSSAVDYRSALLIASLAVQARCGELGIPVPALKDLRLWACRHEPGDGGSWLVEFKREPGRSDEPGAFRAGRVRIRDGEIDDSSVEVLVVSVAEVQQATSEELRRLLDSMRVRSQPDLSPLDDLDRYPRFWC